jgi:hypothetical protein
MTGERSFHRRRRAAWLCVLAMTGSVVALPAMHAAVHLAERLVALGAAPAPPPVIVVRHGHCHGGSCHVDGEPGDPRAPKRPTPHEPHHHDGDRPGEHGRSSGAHLVVLLAPAAAPALPPRVEPAILVERTLTPPTFAPVTLPTHAARAPPAASA